MADIAVVVVVAGLLSGGGSTPPCLLQCFLALPHGHHSPPFVRYGLATPSAWAAPRHVGQLFTRRLCSHSLLPLPQTEQRLLCIDDLPHLHKHQPPWMRHIDLDLPQPHRPMCETHLGQFLIKVPHGQNLCGEHCGHLVFKTSCEHSLNVRPRTLTPRTLAAISVYC